MNVYSKAMGKSMRALFDLHAEQVTLNKAITTEKMHSIKYLHEFDREFQCATWGYPTEGAYYRDATSADSVFAIRIPTMCLHAKDDPIACDEAVPYEEIKQTPYVVMCATSGGGHLSWFEFGGERWHSKPVSCFGFLVIMIASSWLDAADNPSPSRPSTSLTPWQGRSTLTSLSRRRCLSRVRRVDTSRRSLSIR